MEGRPEKFSWLSFEKQVQATKEYKSDPGRRCGEPGEGFGKKAAWMTFSSTPNISKLIFWSAELELIHFWRSGHGEKHMMKTVGICAFIQWYVVSYNTPFILPSHLLRTSSYMNFFRIQCNFILCKYTHNYFVGLICYVYIQRENTTD